jgi:hypothetical protein
MSVAMIALKVMCFIVFSIRDDIQFDLAPKNESLIELVIHYKVPGNAITTVSADKAGMQIFEFVFCDWWVILSLVVC